MKATAAARQILVTAVAAGSPAAGVLEKGDVIVGIDGEPFASDARLALARLAGGMPDRRSLVADYARAVAKHKPGGHISWGYAYETLFLAEYVLATDDRSVLPGLERLALDVAREAGVKSPDLDAAIDRSERFLRWYVGKGAIPYGDHAPWPDHEDNGTCSSVTVLFDTLGRRDGAAFFARMSTAAHAERECGHTGNFFNVLWALPGVSRLGPAATGAYLRETAWYYDLARGWDGRWNFWDGLAAEYEPRPTTALVAGLSSWSPTVRERSAKARATKADAPVAKVVALLDSKVDETRWGGCVAVKHLGPLAEVLFKPGPGKREPRSILASSLDAADQAHRQLLVAAIREVMHAEDGRVRGGAAATYGRLSRSELAELMPDILDTIRTPAPSGEMFAYDIRMRGLEILAQHRIREGMDLALQILNEDRWGRDFNRAAKALSAYGGAARHLVPTLRDETRAIADKAKGKDWAATLDRVIRTIEDDRQPKPVQGADEFVAANRRPTAAAIPTRPTGGT